MEQMLPEAYAVQANMLNQPIEQLSSFCRGEMSAVESYERALDVTQQGWIVTQLLSNMESHTRRAELLRQRILELGGEPPTSSGPWGAFAGVVEGVASAIGERVALSILEEGERHGLADYRADFQNLDADSQRLVGDRILPQQVHTHTSLHEIVRTLTM